MKSPGECPYPLVPEPVPLLGVREQGWVNQGRLITSSSRVWEKDGKSLMKSKVIISYSLVKQMQTGVHSGAVPENDFLNNFLKIIF